MFTSIGDDGLKDQSNGASSDTSTMGQVGSDNYNDGWVKREDEYIYMMKM